MQNDPKTQHSKNAESQRQEENLADSKRKTTPNLQGDLNKVDSWFLSRNNVAWDNRISYSKCSNEVKNNNQQFYIKQSYFSKRKLTTDISE